MPSIGNLNAKITADAQQFVSEFARADNAARRSSTAIDAEVSKLTKNIKKKFSASDVGKDLLRGFGIGSGFAVAQMAAEKIAGFWREAAENAKSIEASSEVALQATLKGLDARKNEAQKLEAAIKEQARLTRELEAAQKPKEITSTWDAMKAVGRAVGTKVGIADNSQTKEVFDAGAKVAVQGALVDELKLQKEKAVAKERETMRKAEIELDFALAAARKKQIEEEIAANAKAFHAEQDELKRSAEKADELAQKYREIADPALKYKEQLAEINALHAAGKLKADEAADAIRNVTAAMNDDESGRINADLKDFYQELDDASKKAFENMKAGQEEVNRIVGRGADGIADAWVDSLSGAEDAWKNFGASVIRELARVAFQVAVVKPLINSLGGAMGGGGGIWGSIASAFVSYGTGKATGGGTEGGVTYRVNEQGQEFFKSNQGGTIIPAGIAKNMTEKGGRGGNVYNIDARGADAGVEQRITRAMLALAGPGVSERRAINAVSNNSRRRAA